MRRGEGIVHVEIAQRRKTPHEPGVEHLGSLELDRALEGRNLLREIAQVAENDGLALPQGADGLQRPGAADVVYIRDLPARERGKLLRVLGQRYQILVVERVALVGDERHLGPALEKPIQGRHRLLDAIGVDDALSSRVDGGVDVRAEDDGRAPDIEVRHRPDLYSRAFHFPIPRYLFVVSVASMRSDCIFMQARTASMFSGMTTASCGTLMANMMSLPLITIESSQSNHSLPVPCNF